MIHAVMSITIRELCRHVEFNRLRSAYINGLLFISFEDLYFDTCVSFCAVVLAL